MIEGVPNYYTKSIIPIKHNDIEENTELIWSIVENQGVFNYDSSKLEYFYELKTLYGTTANIVESTGRLNIDNSYIIYYQTYFNGIPKLEKNSMGVVKKYYFDDYGNIFKEQIYNENDLSENISIDYSYDDYTHYVQSLREMPISITQNNSTTYLNYDSINQQLDSYNNTLQKVHYDYDAFKNKIYRITFSEALNNTGVGYNEIKYIPNSNVKALCSKDNNKFEFLYDKFGNVKSIKNNGKEILDYNYQENEIENIYTIVRASGDGSIVNEIAKYDKYGKIKEYSLNEDEEKKVTYEYEEKNTSDYLKRLVKINDGFSNEIHNITYTDNVKIPYYTETIENKQYVKKSDNLLEYKLGSDNEAYLYNLNIIPFPNSKLTSTYVERINDVDKNIESFSFVYENDKLNRLNKKTRTHKLCRVCHTDECLQEKIERTRVEKQIDYVDNTNLPEKITYVTTITYPAPYSTSREFSYINTYENGNIVKVVNDGEYYPENPYLNPEYILCNNKKYTYEYTYDDQNRIIQDKIFYDSILKVDNTYVYDNNSNMILRKTTNSKPIEFTNENGKLTKINNNGIITNIEYDDFGNMLNDSKFTFSYDERGHLSSCTYLENEGSDYPTYHKYDYYYNYQGKRYKKEILQDVPGMLTLHFFKNYYLDDEKILGEDWVDISGNVFQKFRYFYDSEGISGIRYNGYDYNLIKDSLGNVSKLMYQGKTIGEYIYDAWGNCTIIENLCEEYVNDVDEDKEAYDSFVLKNNPFRYKGYYYDIETNLFLVSSRYYSPELCRWISPDDIEYLDPESVNGLNLYCYCFNNPISYYDPNGHFPVLLASILIGAAIGFGLAYGADVIEKVQEDGFQLSDIIDPLKSKENWKEYTIAILKGAVTGAAFGAGAGLGISAFKAGVRIAAKTAITAFIATTAGSAAAGMGIYALETKVFGLGEYNQSDLWKAGVKMGIKGGLNFGTGLLLGNQGFWNVKNSLIQRTYLKSTLMTPTDMIIEGLIDSLW